MPLLSEALNEAITAIDGKIEKIGLGSEGEAELGDVRSQILSILWLVERDPGIEAAADDLYDATAAVVRFKDEGDTGSRHRRIMNEAAGRFKQRLDSAVPSAQAVKLGLTTPARQDG